MSEEEALARLRLDIYNQRMVSGNPHGGNGGRWSDFMKLAENQFEDVGSALCECGRWCPCRHCEDDNED